jgi:hypothetical protein
MFSVDSSVHPGDPIRVTVEEADAVYMSDVVELPGASDQLACCEVDALAQRRLFGELEERR